MADRQLTLKGLDWLASLGAPAGLIETARKGVDAGPAADPDASGSEASRSGAPRSGRPVPVLQVPVLQAITVYPDTAAIVGGEQQQFSATGEYSDGSSRVVTGEVAWTSSDPAILIGADGLATARPVSGTATITATDPHSGVSAAARVSVAPPRPGPSVNKITVTPASPALVGPAVFGAPAPRQQFQATGLFADGSTRDLTGRVEWRSSAPRVVAVGPGGLGTVGTEPGTATITATDPASAAAGVAVSGSATVTVTIPAVQSIAISPADASMDVGGTRQFKVVRVYSDGTRQDLAGAGRGTVSWTATGGLFVEETGVAHARQVGAATLTAEDAASGRRATLTLTVVGERSMPTPFGTFAYTLADEAEVKALLARAVQAYGAAETLDEEMDARVIALDEAQRKVGRLDAVEGEVARYTGSQTKRDASVATTAEILDGATQSFLSLLRTLLEGAEADVVLAARALKRAEDTEAAIHYRAIAQEMEEQLHVVVSLAKMAVAAKPAEAFGAALELFEGYAKAENAFAKEAARLEKEVADGALADAVAKLRQARRTVHLIKPDLAANQARVRKAGENAAETWKIAETGYDRSPGNKGAFRFQAVRQAVPLAAAASDAALRAAGAASAALDAARALARPSEPPSLWMANVPEGQRIIAAMTEAARGMFEQAIAKHNDAKAALQKLRDAHAAARQAMAKAPGESAP